MQEKKKLQINKYLFISIASICAGIFVWWLVTDGLGIFRSNALPSPVKVASTFVKKWFETKPDGATLLQHLGASLQVALGGYLIGAIIGIPLGIFMAWNDKVDMLVRPVFDLVRTIPGIAWTSVMVTLVGIGFLSKALVIFISAMVARLSTVIPVLSRQKPCTCGSVRPSVQALGAADQSSDSVCTADDLHRSGRCSRLRMDHTGCSRTAGFH